MDHFRVVVTDDRYHDYDAEREVLSAVGAELTVCDCTTPQEVLEACREADGILCNLAPMPREVIEQLGRCKVINRYGVGYDNVDAIACSEQGIALTNVPDYCAEEVSDHALALMLACGRGIAFRDRGVRRGEWNLSWPTQRIAGSTCALLGFGVIARCLRRKLTGFHLREILVYDPFVDAEKIAAYGCRKVELNEALTQADFISVHIPLNANTKGLLSEAEFTRMKSSAVLVNTSRGSVVDQKALAQALKQGQLAAAGLDVFETEPLAADDPLRMLENCILSDHAGWYSQQSVGELKRRSAQNVADTLTGKGCQFIVNQPKGGGNHV